MKRFLSVFVCGILSAQPVFSQGFRSDSPLSAPAYLRPASTGSVANPAQMNAELARMEEQMRMMRGEIERLQFEIRQLKEGQTRFQEDIEYRFQEIDGGGMDAGAMMPQEDIGGYNTQEAPVTIPSRADNMAGMSPASSTNSQVQYPQAQPFADPTNVQPLPGSAMRPTMRLRAPGQSNPRVSVPRDLYDQGFRLLNQTDYSGAEEAFKAFTEQFPSDPLIGNAWYWLGETYYVRRNYVQAADSFRRGYEVLEEGPKAGDNLLKLAMSLAAMQKDQEACVVLKQVDKNYGENSKTLRNKARQELNRLGC